MSAEALVYVKKLTKAPNGEEVRPMEKLLLWYIADGHNDEKRAAWHKIATMAGHNNLSSRRVRELLADCIRKGILWREERFREDDSNQSNYWRFAELDGPPTTAAMVAEEKRRIRGEMAAAKTNATKSRKKSTDACESGCESPQGTDANSRIDEREESQGEDANSRTLVREESQGEDADSRMDGREMSHPLNHHLSASEPPLTLQLNSAIQPSTEAPQAATVEIPKGTWAKVLAAMLTSGKFTEAEFLRVTACTREMQSVRIGERVEIEVGMLEAEMLGVLSGVMDELKRSTGMKPGNLNFRLQFIQKGAA
ncbi:MAG: hypothetical protein JWO13_2256 [Acidobacteriales bacterium]|nr:hypothetical protein [Terriglobales bacterium]